MNEEYNTEDDEAARRELLEAQERLDRARQQIRAARRESQDRQLRTEQTDSERQRDSEDSDGFRRIRKEATFGGSVATKPPETLSTQLPLKRFVEQAANISIERAEDISRGEWKSLTWEFTRLCKTHPKLMPLTANEAFKAIPWHVTQFGEEEQMQFLVEWNAVMHLPGVPVLEWAASMARRYPLCSTRKQFDSYNRFISLAGWLQVIMLRSRETKIFLPTRKVAEILGLKSHVQVATLCKLAVADELLEVVERHTAIKATRYRFAVERYGILNEHLGTGQH